MCSHGACESDGPCAGEDLPVRKEGDEAAVQGREQSVSGPVPSCSLVLVFL